MRLKTIVLGLALMLGASAAMADVTTSEAKRLSNAAIVVKELRGTPDNNIPEDLWGKAECVAVIPGLKKAAFIVGGEYGKGVMSCRSGDRWSAPVFMQLAKGSWGFQAGAEQVTRRCREGLFGTHRRLRTRWLAGVNQGRFHGASPSA